jgi:hypothetical protein
MGPRPRESYELLTWTPDRYFCKRMYQVAHTELNEGIRVHISLLFLYSNMP